MKVKYVSFLIVFCLSFYFNLLFNVRFFWLISSLTSYTLILSKWNLSEVDQSHTRCLKDERRAKKNHTHSSKEKKDSEIQKEISTTIIIMFCQHRSKKPHSESIRKCCVCCRFQCFEIERVPCERCTKSNIQIKTEHRQTCFELVNKWFNGIYTRNEATS